MTQTVGIRSEFQSIRRIGVLGLAGGSSPLATTLRPRLDAVRGAGVHVAERARSRALDPLLADVVVRHDERDAGVDRVLDRTRRSRREREERDEGEPPHPPAYSASSCSSSTAESTPPGHPRRTFPPGPTRTTTGASRAA